MNKALVLAGVIICMTGSLQADGLGDELLKILEREQTAQQEREKLSLQRFYSRDYHYSIEFPETWEPMSLEDPGALGSVSLMESSTDDFRENALVGSYKLDYPLTVLEYFQAGFRGLKDEIEGLEVLGLEETQMGGMEAIRLDFIIPQPSGSDYRMIQIVTVKGQRAYILAAMGKADVFDEYSETFERIIASFRFEDGAEGEEQKSSEDGQEPAEDLNQTQP